MILFPNCKINLGLQILSRRPDGYHDIATVMIPVDWTDVLEIVPAFPGRPTSLHTSGRPVECPPEKNLVMKAWRRVKERFPDMPDADIYLHKIIPDGAGLGGGSADAAFTIRGLNSLFCLGMTDGEMAIVAAEVGMDCPFFIYNRPMYCTGRGEIMEPADVSLDGLSIVIAKPGDGVSTAAAYSGVTPGVPPVTVPEILSAPVNEWQGKLVNDFEKSIFPQCPHIEALKTEMLRLGAVYSSMSGSGSSVFAIFDRDNLADRAVDALADFTVKRVK